MRPGVLCSVRDLDEVMMAYPQRVVATHAYLKKGDAILVSEVDAFLDGVLCRIVYTPPPLGDDPLPLDNVRARKGGFEFL